MTSTFTIGDIHGALRALKMLMDRLKPKPDDLLVFLGDYVDGWPDSAGVIRYLMELEKRQRCIFLKGNHDLWCEQWLHGAPADVVWLQHGGQPTIDSYQQVSWEEKQQHLAFFQRMKPNYQEEQYFFVHAGFTSMHGPAFERISSNFYWDRTLWETALAADPSFTPDHIRYPRRLTHFKRIFIGHTPTTNYGTDKPMLACNVWNMDTGAAYRGRLTAMNVRTEQFIQSDPVHLLYPGERGRNL